MEYWIWLTLISGIGTKTANRLLDKFESPLDIYQSDECVLKQSGVLTKRQISMLCACHDLDSARHIVKNCNRHGISILTKADERYPAKAKHYDDAPIVLYYKGQLRNLQRSVGIVGARRCTQTDKYKAATITEKYVADGWAIVSGMAKGIDSYAHTACLNAGGYTVAIVGNGLDICYPSEHERLMDAIEENGLLLSEYPPGTQPSRYTFPQRNRLISSWSDEVVVIGAGKGSGALITAGIAEKQGKRVVMKYAREDNKGQPVGRQYNK